MFSDNHTACECGYSTCWAIVPPISKPDSQLEEDGVRRGLKERIRTLESMMLVSQSQHYHRHWNRLLLLPPPMSNRTTLNHRSQRRNCYSNTSMASFPSPAPSHSPLEAESTPTSLALSVACSLLTRRSAQRIGLEQRKCQGMSVVMPPAT